MGNSSKKQGTFDPDKLVLSKDEILQFCDSVLERWVKDKKKTPQQIFAMNAVRTSVYLTDDESLKAIWSEILKWTNELLYQNALSEGNSDNKKWSKTMKKIKK